MKNLINNKLLMVGISSFLIGNGLKQINGILSDHVSCFVIGFSLSIMLVSIVKDYLLNKSV